MPNARFFPRLAPGECYAVECCDWLFSLLKLAHIQYYGKDLYQIREKTDIGRGRLLYADGSIGLVNKELLDIFF